MPDIGIDVGQARSRADPLAAHVIEAFQQVFEEPDLKTTDGCKVRISAFGGVSLVVPAVPG